MLNATGPFSPDTLSLMRTVVEAGVPYADINDNVETLQRVFDSEYLASLAKHRGVGVLPGLGASPGQTNMVAPAGAVRATSPALRRRPVDRGSGDVGI